MIEKIEISCDSCIWNDDGLCDKLGYIVSQGDEPHCKGEWEPKEG